MELSDGLAWAATFFDNASKAVIAAGVFVSVLLTRVAFKARKEPPPPGTPDALVLALGELTKVTKGQSGNFEHNMRLFEDLNRMVKDMADDVEDVRRAVDAAREHLAAIRDGVNRGGK